MWAARRVARPTLASDGGALGSGMSTGPSLDASTEATDFLRARLPGELCDEALGVRLRLRLAFMTRPSSCSAFSFSFSFSYEYVITVSAAADGDGEMDRVGATVVHREAVGFLGIAFALVAMAEVVAGFGFVEPFSLGAFRASVVGRGVDKGVLLADNGVEV